jgi:trehalose 6-phosphate phosphatase
MSINDLPVLDSRSALFLDFDGTLAEIAPRPEAVALLPGIVPALIALQRRLGGALALISGRPIDQLDTFMQPLSLPMAGVHGVERRGADGKLSRVAAPALDALEREAQALADAHPGVLVERKPGALALHYRLSPQSECLCLALMQRAVQDSSQLSLLHGNKVVEVKPAGATKGHAIADFLQEPPFAGRRPVFAGDDTTDEAGFAVAQQHGGEGIKVGQGPTLARHRVANPSALLDWLRNGAARLVGA